MVKWHNSRIINNNIDPSPQVWNISMAIFTLYMYSIRKVIMYNCHLDTQPGDLGPFKGCYSVTSTERSFSPRSKKRLETSKHPLNGGSGIFLFELIGINRGMIQKVGQNLSPKIKQVGYRRSKCRWITCLTSMRAWRHTFTKSEIAWPSVWSRDGNFFRSLSFSTVLLPASYPGLFALSEWSEEAWNRARLTGDVTSKIAEDDWERGCSASSSYYLTRY